MKDLEVELFDDMVLFEFMKEEWSRESQKSRIIRPDTVKDKQDGEFQQKAPWDFFRVVAVGPDCKKVKIGDICFPRQPDLHHQPQMLPVIFYLGNEQVIRYEVSESNIGGRRI